MISWSRRIVPWLLWWAGLAAIASRAAADDRPPPVPTNPIAMIGDSLTRQGDWSKVLNRSDVTNWGIPGYTTGQLAWTFKDLVKLQPGLKVVFLSGGGNDLLLGVPMERIYQNQVDAVTYWRERGVTPVVQSVVPKARDSQKNAIIAALNAKLERYCEQEKVHYLNLTAVLSTGGELVPELSQADGVHLKPEAYPRWAKLVQAKLSELGY